MRAHIHLMVAEMVGEVDGHQLEVGCGEEKEVVASAVCLYFQHLGLVAHFLVHLVVK